HPPGRAGAGHQPGTGDPAEEEGVGVRPRARARARARARSLSGSVHEPAAGRNRKSQRPSTSTSTTGMLRIQGLNKIYPNGTRARRDLNRAVADGEFLVIIGLAGGGKSTLRRCINRLVDPPSGRIELDGTDITAASPAGLRRIRARIGMIF